MQSAVKNDQPCPEGKVKRDGKCMMPEVTFTAFILSLNTSVLYHLGELADPHSGAKNKDLVLAKHAIDTLSMLQEKTKGNLSDEEKKTLENFLYDLRLRYVNACR